MPVTNLSRVKSIVVPITESDGNSIITIYQNTGVTIGNELMEGYKVVSFNCFIKNLKAYAKINSLGAVNLPDLKLEDTETEKLYKVLDTQWKSPRKHLNLFISNNTTDWHPVASISLLNPSGYPYKMYNLMDLFTNNLAIELGDNSRIGIQIEDVGYGVLTGDDRVTIHGSYVEEIFLESSEPPINININVTGGGTPTIPDYSFGNNSLVDNSFLVGN